MENYCPLCKSEQIRSFQKFDNKQYLICDNCDLVFLPRKYHLSHDEEKKRYDLHENNPEDDNYREFLSGMLNAILDYVDKPADGLDYGSGPGPALAQMLEENGYKMDIYDPYYAPNSFIYKKKYDFVTCTEVVEHLARPGEEFQKITGLLKSSGIFGIMTRLRDADINFSNWHYRRDPTHVCFYSDKTFKWIARQYKFERRKISDKINIFVKN